MSQAAGRHEFRIMNVKMDYRLLWVRVNDRDRRLPESLEERRGQPSSKGWPKIIDTDTELLLEPGFPL